MSSIWVTLLDTSGSMSNGFSATTSSAPDPLAEQGAWKTKLEAAKDVLLKRIARIHVADVALFEFKGAPSKLFQGGRDQLLARPEIIQSLEASNGTNIAAAIAAVEADPSFKAYQSLSLLIVSDGLSDLTAAKAAAEALLRRYPHARIDTILIDETDEGRKVAEAISLNGDFIPVTSTAQLGAAVARARLSSLQSNLARMAFFRLQAQRELAVFEQIAEPTLVSVTSGQRLTARTLRDEVVPTLLGLEAFGQASSELQGREYRGAVSSISQDSPISINLTGLKEAVELALRYVLPWRRENARRLEAAEVTKRELEVERDRKDLDMRPYDEEQRSLELHRIRLELAKAKLELAERMLKAIDPNTTMEGPDRELALSRLLSGVEHMSAARLDFRVVHDELPRG